MALTNQNKPILDLPFFELCSQPPVATQAISAITTDDDGLGQFIYYLTGTTFLRYDVIGDSWQTLATPPVAAVTGASMRLTKRRGFHCRVINATSTTLQIPGLRGGILNGKTFRVQRGTGAGQVRTLSYTGETIHEYGVITGTSTATLADSTKQWEPNQWAGYMVGITFGTDATQYKRILYNDATTLYVADANLQPHDPWAAPYVAAAPYALPVTTAGAQAHYQIMSSTYSVSAWSTVPDRTSFGSVLTNGIFLLSSAAAAPFFTLQYYDIANDTWITKTCPQSLLLAAIGTDFTIERISQTGAALATKVGTVAGAARTLTDSGQTFTGNRYANHRLVITGGTGMGQERRIVANTATVLTIAQNWDINPDATSTYEIWADYDRIYMGGNAGASLFGYSPEKDHWSSAPVFAEGVVTNIACRVSGWESLGVATGVRIAAGVQAINPVPTAGGSGYAIGNILTCSVGGTGAQVIVTSVSATGAVLGIKLTHAGTATGYTISSGNATTGGAGTGCTIAITAVGPTALITLATAHWLKAGDVVTFSGCTEGLWNAAHTIIGVNGTTSFSVATTATANMAATASQGTTTIVDPTANWVVNEHVGRLVHLMVAGTAPTSQVRWITANTANTLTVATIVAGVNGTSKYVIYDAKAYGTDDQRKESDKTGYGFAASGSTTTLVDASKNWIPGQWVGYSFKVEAGTGYGSGRIAITANSSNTLTFAAQGFTPDATTYYEIADGWGLMSAGSASSITESGAKNWAVNQWAGKRVRITGGTALGQESTIASNTATVLTTGAITAPDATSTYAILSIPARGAGIEMLWLYGVSDATRKGRFIAFPRGGGSNTIDLFDLTTCKWTYGMQFSPQSEVMNTGTSYAYDGVDTIVIAKSVAALPVRLLALDVNALTVRALMQTTFPQGTLHIGNFCEMITTSDGFHYLYLLQNTGTILVRALVS